MAKVISETQRTCKPFDKTHVVGYINEEVDENYVDELHGADSENTEQTPRKVYKYDEVIIESPDMTRDNLVNGLIRSKYSPTQEFAILRHHASSPDKYNDEWTEYNTFVEEAKKNVAKWLIK